MDDNEGSKETGSSVTRSLFFDGSDKSKWAIWSFKLLAYANDKDCEDAFTSIFIIPTDEKTWTDENKADMKRIKRAWGILARVVDGHALEVMLQIPEKES